MKNPGWSVLVVALLLGIVTGDCVVSTQGKASQGEVTDLKLQPSGLPWSSAFEPYTK